MSAECDAAPAAVPACHIAAVLSVLRAAFVLATMSLARQECVGIVSGSRGPALVQVMQRRFAAPRNA